MTWRAFIIGMIGVVGLAFFTPINDYAIGNTFLTGNHFPVGVVFFVLVLTLVANLLIKLVRRAWAFRRSELMLIWCMMLVSATVPASGLMRYWFPTAASAPYLAQRTDIYWEEHVLPQAPEGILLSKDPRSVAANRFYQGTPQDEVIRVPWSRWWKVIVRWSGFIWLYFLVTFFLCALLRKRWVEEERLIFPLARVPLEFTEGSRADRLVPELFTRKVFLIGAAFTVIFGLIRLAPVLAGTGTGWKPVVPIWNVLVDTPLVHSGIANGIIYPIAIGFAFLVPSDISLSIWLFYLFIPFEMQTAWSLGRPIEGGWGGQFMRWQQAGAWVTMAAGLVWTARRHLWAVLRHAVAADSTVDDSEEPISLRLAFWGFLGSAGGMVAWYWWFGLNPLVGLVMLLLVLSILLVHARLVTQGGLFFTQHTWNAVNLIHGVSGGTAFGATAAVVAQAQYGILFSDAREILSPHVMNSLRISSAFKKYRRLFLPIMLSALAVSMVVAGYSTLRYVFYDVGALNIKQSYSVISHPQGMFKGAHRIITQPTQSAQPHYWGLGIGAVFMFVLMALRRTFYWWPVHALGFVVCESWAIRELWFSFLLGWSAKMLILKFGGGEMLRKARTFFLAVIITESAVIGITTIVSLITGTPTGYVFLSL